MAADSLLKPCIFTFFLCSSSDFLSFWKNLLMPLSSISLVIEVWDPRLFPCWLVGAEPGGMPAWEMLLYSERKWKFSAWQVCIDQLPRWMLVDSHWLHYYTWEMLQYPVMSFDKANLYAFINLFYSIRVLWFLSWGVGRRGGGVRIGPGYPFALIFLENGSHN